MTIKHICRFLETYIIKVYILHENNIHFIMYNIIYITYDTFFWKNIFEKNIKYILHVKRFFCIMYNNINMTTNHYMFALWNSLHDN